MGEGTLESIQTIAFCLQGTPRPQRMGLNWLKDTPSSLKEAQQLQQFHQVLGKKEVFSQEFAKLSSLLLSFVFGK